MGNYYDRFDKVAVYDADLNFIEDLAYESDHPSHGIPDEYFMGERPHVFVYLDTRTGFAEWISGVGPAPCYENGANLSRGELIKLVNEFVQENY